MGWKKYRSRIRDEFLGSVKQTQNGTVFTVPCMFKTWQFVWPPPTPPPFSSLFSSLPLPLLFLFPSHFLSSSFPTSPFSFLPHLNVVFYSLIRTIYCDDAVVRLPSPWFWTADLQITKKRWLFHRFTDNLGWALCCIRHNILDSTVTLETCSC